MFLAFDGGGSKLNALLFDEEMNILAEAHSGGVNTTQASVEDCYNNVNSCVDDLFSIRDIPYVKRMHSTIIGRYDFVKEAVERHTRVGEFISSGEAYSGLLAGDLRPSGLNVVCGTGATIGYVADDQRTFGVGGWGPILGDDGSGPWMGQQAIRAAVRMVAGWGEDTLLHRFIMEQWQLERNWDMVKKVHSSPAPMRTVGSLTRAVGRAADAGDKVALDIIEEAARLLAVQTATAIAKYSIPLDKQRAVMSGGAWNTHPLLPELFRRKLRELCPAADAVRSLFEPVVAGPVSELINYSNLSREEAFKILNDKMNSYRVSGSAFS